MDNRPIIIIDDDNDDLEMMQDAFKALKTENEIIVFNNGHKFLDYIKNTNITSFFILCDINMPYLSGLELKKIIFEDERLRIKCVPFIFLSTSPASDSVMKAYSFGVQGYFIKPDSFEKLKSTLGSIMQYWTGSQRPSFEQNSKP